MQSECSLKRARKVRDRSHLIDGTYPPTAELQATVLIMPNLLSGLGFVAYSARLMVRLRLSHRTAGLIIVIIVPAPSPLPEMHPRPPLRSATSPVAALRLLGGYLRRRTIASRLKDSDCSLSQPRAQVASGSNNRMSY